MHNILAAAALALGIAAFAPAAQAAPLQAVGTIPETTRSQAVEPAHYRRYRHRHIQRVRVCRWFQGRRYCRIETRRYWHGGRVWRRW